MEKKEKKFSSKVKKKSVNQLRNVLIQPEKEYWPIIDFTHAESLIASLLSLLTEGFEASETISKTIGTKTYSRKIEPATNIERRKYIRTNMKFGVNEVSKGIEKGIIGCAIVAEDCAPDDLGKHVCSIAKTKGVPVIVVPNLKNATKSYRHNFIAAAFMKSCFETASPFLEICSKIKELANLENVKKRKLEFDSPVVLRVQNNGQKRRKKI